MTVTKLLVASTALFASVGCGSESPTVAVPVLPPPPPFGGTIFIAPGIITPSDPTTFVGLEDAGRGSRVMFDRRVDGWITVDAFLFDATYDDGLGIEVQVNPEFGPGPAQVEAAFYAEAIGRLPTALRQDVETVWIHQGDEPFGGGNNNILIHVVQGRRYVADGILEETLVHEGVHTSLDADHALSAGWAAAQAADPTFISTYARDYPGREDMAESFVPYLAVRFRPDRIPETLRSTIEKTIPNRMAYFDGLGLEMHPIE